MINGQRWSSPAEPEIGLGLILDVGERTVRVLFPATGDTRQYARSSAPLRRAVFRPGDMIRGQDTPPFTIDHVVEAHGLVTYHGEGHVVPEANLHDATSFTTPPDRLRAGEIDDSIAFDIRHDALVARQRLASSPVRGLIGGRMSLLGHQLHIAADVTSRSAPRVLLADEVGLGKTVEAGLIAHRLLRTGRIGRVLILVPEPLVHQWFVEMLRRFNLWFHIFDEERCLSIEAGEEDANPFLDEQWVLCGIDFPVEHATRAVQLVEAEWDLVIVDEAHHLAWSPDEPGADYRLIEALAARTPSLLLLTATPEQLGEQSHFARLRLLDPDRFPSYEAYHKEATTYHDIAAVVARLDAGEPLGEEDHDALAGRLHEAGLVGELDRARGDDALHAAREHLIERLIDCHGPCRVMYRNTRATLAGFPGRAVHLVPLERPERFEAASISDPRVQWLADFLREDPERKVLLIVHEQEVVLRLADALPRLVNAAIGIFHEDLPLVQRDRQAAWFAEPEGAQVLLCSEIGGEGRNFQFAHHLVLFDLPMHPERLEQRIGRLDRIGQTETIRIHVPMLKGSPEAVLARWYREGLQAFSAPLVGGALYEERFRDALHGLLTHLDETGDIDEKRLAALVEDTLAFHSTVQHDLETGRDRLLERGSYRPARAAAIIDAITAEEEAHSVETFLLSLFDLFGVKADDMTDDTWQLIPDDLYVDTFPGLPREGMIVTMERDVAVVRDNIEFVSWDHPLVEGGFELLLGSEKGNAAFSVWETEGPRDLLLEALHVIECPAPNRLHIGRFLPPTLVRTVVSLREGDITEDLPAATLRAVILDGQPTRILDGSDVVQRVLPNLLETTRERAEAALQPTADAARKRAHESLTEEYDRLLALREINDHVRPEEIAHIAGEREAIDEAIASSRLRLDALRLIWKGPVPDLTV